MSDGFSPVQIALLLFAAPVTAAVIRLLMAQAPRWGLVDHPGHRKVHRHPTPLVGGLGMFLIMVSFQLMTGGIPFGSWSLLIALCIVTGIGLADDAHELSHRSKFLAQAIGAVVIVSGTSVWVTSFGDLVGLGVMELGKWGMLVTIVALVGVMNAINMIDGLDGLAGTVSLMSLLVLAGVAIGSGEAGTAFELLLIAGTVFGFLLLNWRIPGRARAMVFMGDTGGMILGLLLAWYSIKLGGTSMSAIKPITAVWVLAVPLLDMGSVMLLRIYQRKSPFHADQQHMHHLLLHAGYSVSQVVLIMAGFALGLGLIGIAGERHGVPQAAMFLAFIGLWGVYLAALTRPDVLKRAARRIIRPAAREQVGPAG